LTYLDSIILGIVEGLTEYLPVSSTGHLTIAEKMLGLTVDNPAVTAYTAIIQLGAIAATVVYFFKDIVRLLGAWFRGLRSAQDRTHHDYQLAWAVIVGSIPVAIVGFLARKAITGGLRSLWVVAAALILWRRGHVGGREAPWRSRKERCPAWRGSGHYAWTECSSAWSSASH